MTGWFELIIMGPRKFLAAVVIHSESGRTLRKELVIDLKHSLVIEGTEDPSFFGFYSPELDGFTGVGHSIEDCLYKAKWGMEEHLQLLTTQQLPVPEPNPNPTVTVQNAERVAQQPS